MFHVTLRDGESFEASMLRAGLKTKLVLALVALFLPIFVLLVVDFGITYEGQMERVLDGQMNSASFLASLVDFTLDGGVSLAQVIAQIPLVQSLNAETIYPILVTESNVRPQYDDIAIVDASGQGVVSVRLPPGTPVVNVADRPYFQEAMATGRPVVSNLVASRGTGNPVIVNAAPIPGPDARPIGVAIAALSAKFLEDRIASLALPSGQTVFLADRTGRVAFHLGGPGLELEGTDQSGCLPVASVLKGMSFRGTIRDALLGDERAVVAVSTPKHGWTVGVSTPTAQVRAAVLTPLTGRLAIYLGVMVAVVAVSVVLAQRILVAPLTMLIARLRAFGRGDLGQRIKLRTGDELDTVAQAFNRMADEVQARERELELRSLLLDAANESVFLHDSDLRILYVNRAACETHGYEKEELLAMGLLPLIAPQDAGLAEERVQALMDKGEITLEIDHIRRDGSVFPVELHSRVVELGGRELVLGVARDVTERKRAEQALHETTQRLQALVNASPLAINVIDLSR